LLVAMIGLGLGDAAAKVPPKRGVVVGTIEQVQGHRIQVKVVRAVNGRGKKVEAPATLWIEVDKHTRFRDKLRKLKARRAIKILDKLATGETLRARGRFGEGWKLDARRLARTRPADEQPAVTPWQVPPPEEPTKPTQGDPIFAGYGPEMTAAQAAQCAQEHPAGVDAEITGAVDAVKPVADGFVVRVVRPASKDADGTDLRMTHRRIWVRWAAPAVEDAKENEVPEQTPPKIGAKIECSGSWRVSLGSDGIGRAAFDCEAAVTH
jgi:hypothetical protein